MSRRAVTVLVVTLLICCVHSPIRVQAQTVTPPSPNTTWTLRNWTRVEWWRFFEPPAGGGDPEYAYPVNRLQAGVRHDARRYGVNASLQYVQFGGLPSTAVGPGPLGLGAVYYGHAGRSDSHQVYVRYLQLQLKELLPGMTLHVGRMPRCGKACLARDRGGVFADTGWI